MNFRGVPLLLAAILVIGGPQARADEAKDIFDSIPGSFSGGVAVVSDYVFRGVSQTDENPAIQGSIGWSTDFNAGELPLNLALGVWGSNVDFNDGDEATIEIDYSAALSTELAGFGVGVNYVYFSYPGANEDLNYDYQEFGLTLEKDFEVVALSAGAYWSPDFFGSVGDAVYYSLGAEVPLPFEFSLAGHVGTQRFDRSGLDDYVDWSIGLTRPVMGIDLSLTYYDTDVGNGGFCGASSDLCDSRVVFGISKTF